ncbi:MAG: metal ABC transporter permease [Desulfobacterales bacterium]|nr:metal ABC transporter permease [Desulfobacterales bacterium]MDD4072232.1 metal ABC transporter permease [Desulfobacterales bacterium]MDD4393685.1 metal ABC transporter permease [Desulfobacterales bacterium]
MLELLQFEFMRNAIITGILISVICGVIGTLVVVNRLAFLAGGIAHAAYGGIGIAFFFNLPYLPCTLSFSILAAFAMACITIKDKHRSDTIIGVLWATGMAMGVILLDLTPGYNVDFMSYLFGSILTVPKSDIWIIFGFSTYILLSVCWFYNDLLALSYDEEFAHLRGVPVKPMYFMLIGIIAVSVVMTIQVVGLILVIALLTIPPYIAERYSTSLKMMMVLSAMLSLIFTLSGLWISYMLNLTSGATIIMVAVAGFLVSFALERIFPGLFSRPNRPAE